MDWNDIMREYAPKDCQPTEVDNNKDYAAAKEAVAKELGKKVEELTPEDEDLALGKMGLCKLDFLD